MPRYFKTTTGAPAIALNDLSLYESPAPGAPWQTAPLEDLFEELSLPQWQTSYQSWPLPVQVGVYAPVFTLETMQEARWWAGPQLPPIPASRPSPAPVAPATGPLNLFDITEGTFGIEIGDGSLLRAEPVYVLDTPA